MSLLLLLRPHAEEAGPGPTPETGQTPAGRKKRQRKYIVEIDGEEFIVESLDKALSLLDRARELAKQTAEAKANEVVTKSLPRAVRVGKAKQIVIKAPVVTGSEELSNEIQQAQREIKQIYLDASIAAELRLLLILQELDEEETILLLMD